MHTHRHAHRSPLGDMGRPSTGRPPLSGNDVHKAPARTQAAEPDPNLQLREWGEGTRPSVPAGAQRQVAGHPPGPPKVVAEPREVTMG